MASAATRVMLATLLLGAALHFQPCTAGTLITVDFDAPRRGPVCVGATVGDTLKFAWNEYHNLHEMPDSASYTDCKFSAATQLAPAKPNPQGVIVELPAAGTRFFSCSKICKSNGHKVKVCVSNPGSTTTAPACDCSEGTFVGSGRVVSGAAGLRSIWRLATFAAAFASAISLELLRGSRV